MVAYGRDSSCLPARPTGPQHRPPGRASAFSRSGPACSAAGVLRFRFILETRSRSLLAGWLVRFPGSPLWFASLSRRVVRGSVPARLVLGFEWFTSWCNGQAVGFSRQPASYTSWRLHPDLKTGSETKTGHPAALPGPPALSAPIKKPSPTWRGFFGGGWNNRVVYSLVRRWVRFTGWPLVAVPLSRIRYVPWANS